MFIELEAAAATWHFTIVVREGPDGSLLDVSGIAKAVQPKNRSFHQGIRKSPASPEIIIYNDSCECLSSLYTGPLWNMSKNSH